MDQWFTKILTNLIPTLFTKHSSLLLVVIFKLLPSDIFVGLLKLTPKLAKIYGDMTNDAYYYEVTT